MVVRVPVQYSTYLDVGAEFGVDPVGSQHIRQRGGGREGGGDGVAHFGEGEHLEAKLLVHLLQLFVRLLFPLTQDAAHGVPALLWRPLRGHRTSTQAFKIQQWPLKVVAPPAGGRSKHQRTCGGVEIKVV